MLWCRAIAMTKIVLRLGQIILATSPRLGAVTMVRKNLAQSVPTCIPLMPSSARIAPKELSYTRLAKPVYALFDLSPAADER
jgi:hypothetical protein